MIPLTHCISSPQKKIHHIQLLVAQELAAGGALLGSHEALTMYRFKETTAQLPGFCWLSGSSNLSSGVNEGTEHQKKSREVP
jgi:hypothetical protein